MNAPVDVTDICIHTARLILRAWREEDLHDFYEYASVEGVGEKAGWKHHQSVEESKKILGVILVAMAVRLRSIWPIKRPPAISS